MKTPISYYGGKQMMLRHILPMIPAHTTYCEPFFGGGAVFFAKPKSKWEIINDTNDVLINFYRVAQTRFDELAKEVSCYLISRTQYNEAKDIVFGRAQVDDVKRAAALWYLLGLSMNNDATSGCMAIYTNSATHAQKLGSKKDNLLTGKIVKRLEHTVIECRDALRVIAQYDTPETFFYIDPPYIGADMGHYKGYKEPSFIEMLDMLSGIAGKFLLSSYPHDGLNRPGWNTKTVVKPISASNTRRNNNRVARKTECLTYNYSFEGEALDMFDSVEGKGE